MKRLEKRTIERAKETLARFKELQIRYEQKKAFNDDSSSDEENSPCRKSSGGSSGSEEDAPVKQPPKKLRGFFMDDDEDDPVEDDDDEELEDLIDDEADMSYLNGGDDIDPYRAFPADDEDDPMALLNKLTKKEKSSKKRPSDINYESQKPPKRVKSSHDDSQIQRSKEKERIRKERERLKLQAEFAEKEKKARKREKERQKIEQLKKEEEAARIAVEKAKKKKRKEKERALAAKVKAEWSSEYTPSVKAEPSEEYVPATIKSKHSKSRSSIKEEYIPQSIGSSKQTFKQEYTPAAEKPRKEKKKEKVNVKQERYASPPREASSSKPVDFFGTDSESDGGAPNSPPRPQKSKRPEPRQEKAPSRVSHMAVMKLKQEVKTEPEEPELTIAQKIEEKNLAKIKADKKMKKAKNKKNLIAKEEMETEGFSFDAMMSMNTAKVKKKKKSKKLNIDESNASCLQLSKSDMQRLPMTSSSSSTAKAKPPKELNDRDAAFLATTSKKGGITELLAERRKVRLVAKVYPLMEICQRVLTTHPQYLLTCMSQFHYAADVIMPALERLDAKSLNLLEEHQPHLEEDSNHIWRKLCNTKYGVVSSNTVEGRGETWKEGYIRLANENDARLKVLTKKIVKKTATDEKAKLNTKLAFCHGYVKPPPGVKVTRSDMRSKLFDVDVPGYQKSKHHSAKIPGSLGSAPSTNRRDVDHTGRSRVNVASSVNNATKRKTGHLMVKALRGIAKFKR
ncbi:unnamed protein product [Oikopleura dioica]|uniref:Uncharacterized protein n=1 Tax=Oikopleura dioica TaxID=34765 RepID=E4YMC8_OIKDI|nr:unnamed protein product [Oikopleura dioica]